MDGMLHLLLEEAQAHKHCSIYYRRDGTYRTKLLGKWYRGTFDEIREQVTRDIATQHCKNKCRHRASIKLAQSRWGRTWLHIRCFFEGKFHIKSILFHVYHLFR